MLSALALALLAHSATAYPRTPLLFSRQAYQGVATFNDYQKQGQTVCGPIAGAGGTYGAAAGDLSPDISGGMCNAPTTHDMSKCDGTGTVANYQGPSCPTGNCLTCYKVTNRGAYGGGSVGGIGNSVIVQIIDVCPSGHAENYCKTDVPDAERCESPGTNALDIDTPAYQILTGTPAGSGPNLIIDISPSDCSGGSSTGGSSSAGGTPASSGVPGAVSSIPAVASNSGVPVSGGNNNNNGNGNGVPVNSGVPASSSAAPAAVTTPPPAAVSSPAAAGGGVNGGGGAQAPLYGQCGGIDNTNNQPWAGPTACTPPATCQEQNQYYSQCLA